MRRWRGEIDVPLTAGGLGAAYALGENLAHAGGLNVCWHDWLSRDRDTAKAVCDNTFESKGPRPWRMGPAFEGRPLTRPSINAAQWLAENPEVCPHDGEPFGRWYSEWMDWLRGIPTDGKVGVVTHNRNIVAVYASIHGYFNSNNYDCDGPGFCTVHYFKNGYVEPWDGEDMRAGVYLIRHGETSFGT